MSNFWGEAADCCDIILKIKCQIANAIGEVLFHRFNKKQVKEIGQIGGGKLIKSKTLANECSHKTTNTK